MAIYQTNVWVCECCGLIDSTTKETSPYSDPVVAPPRNEEWEYVRRDGKELLACAKCAETQRLSSEQPK